MYLEPSPRRRRRQRRKLILYALLGIGLGVLIGMLSAKAGAAPWPDTTAPAWHFQADVQANCNADHTGVDVGWTFQNRDAKGIHLTVVLGMQMESHDVGPGQLVAGTFAGLPQPLPVGSVRFDMIWLNGSPGRDSATRYYDAVSCLPTAINLTTFTAVGAGNRGGCGRRGENMRYGVACNITDAGVGFVSGACEDGLWFSRVATRRTFRLDQAVRVDGCEGLGSELYAPIRISR